MKDKKVCIIIPTLNEEEHIGVLIDSIQRDPYPNKEIIVVDDGSTDQTLEIVRSKGVVVLINSPGYRGPAYGWNRAARHTDAEVLCILGADFLIEDSNYFKKCISAFDGDTAAVYTAYKTKQDTLVEKIVTRREGVSFEPRFIKRNVFLEVGGFPEIGVGEDVVFTKKLKRFVKERGMKEKIVKGAYFSGHGVHSVSEMYRQAKWYGKTSVLFIRELRGTDKLFQGIKFYSRAVYLLSFISLIFIPYSKVFLITGLPFFLMLSHAALGGIKNKYTVGKCFLYLVFGAGMLHGLVIFFFSRGKIKGGR